MSFSPELYKSHLSATRPLQLIQNAAARLLFNLPSFFYTAPVLHSLHWIPAAAPSSSRLWYWLAGQWKELIIPTSKALFIEHVCIFKRDSHSSSTLNWFIESCFGLKLLKNECDVMSHSTSENHFFFVMIMTHRMIRADRESVQIHRDIRCIGTQT